MVNTIISVDFTKPIQDQKFFHNRYHPEIQPVSSVKTGEIFRVECIDWTGGQIKNDENAIDIREIDLTQCHHLSGPIAVENAEPGDLLEVEILDVQPLPGQEWGYTAIFDTENGGGFLTDIYTQAHKAIWDFEGIFTKSRHIPGVRFAGLIHPGIIGCAPSKELLKEWNRREIKLIKSDPNVIPALAYPPLEKGANLGQGLKGHPKEKDMKLEAARTIPPREHGGNCDIKNLSRGSKVWLPVYVPGANLSMGDIHFSQGDGEIAFCGAIEMSGALTLKTRLIKNGMALHAIKNPIFLPGPVEPRYTKFLTFEGISVDDNGKQHATCPKVSFRNAVLNCIEYMKRFGYTGEQIYLLLSCCPCEGRIASIVDVPNACCTLGIPTEIFDFDITPSVGGHKSKPKGQLASVQKE